MDSEKRLPTESDTRVGSNSLSLLRAEPQETLEDEQMITKEVTVLYCKLLRCMETAVESGRLEPFAEAYARCREDFEALLQDQLHNLNPAFGLLEQLVAVVERRIPELESARMHREDTAVIDPSCVRN